MVWLLFGVIGSRWLGGLVVGFDDLVSFVFVCGWGIGLLIWRLCF